MPHQPVLLSETLHLLAIKPDHLYLDATFGLGGHSQAIMAAGGKVLGLDYDQLAIDQAEQKFAPKIASGQLTLVRANFSALNSLPDVSNQEFEGILFDFGTNADQLTSTQRGLSFQADGPLDMRLDVTLAVTASDLLNFLSVKELMNVLREYGGEEEAGELAKTIKAHLPITSTQQLVDLILKTKKRRTKLHPATKVFQALRIAVNSELDNISQALPQAFSHLKPGGRLVCISFHEGEDRLVKHFFQKLETQHQAKVLTKHPVVPLEKEVGENPRARSAKLRAIERYK